MNIVSSNLDKSINSRGKFSVTSMRPPVPGEENKGLSNHAAGELLRSSAIGSSKLSRSESLTPPAPLGFEPEGSDSVSPRHMEETSRSSGPLYLKWAEELVNLLNDSDGVLLFKEFLEKEQDGSAAALEFWFACSGMKSSMSENSDPERAIGLLKLIYKKYVKGENLRLRIETKKRIVECLRAGRVDSTVLATAQSEIETQLRNDAYPLFLKSDTYLQYIQTGGASPKAASSGNSSGSDGLEVSGLSQNGMTSQLETVPEGHELQSAPVKTLSLTSSALLATRRLREGTAGNSKYYGTTYPSLEVEKSKLSNPYHVSYAPVSAQDSELQSMSSDALTDDTKSYTDSSLDGVWDQNVQLAGNKAAMRKYMRAVRQYAETNKQPDTGPNQFIPRTQFIPPDHNLAQKNPDLFASKLIEKLEKYKRDVEADERVRHSMQSLQEMDSENELSDILDLTGGPNSSMAYNQSFHGMYNGANDASFSHNALAKIKMLTSAMSDAGESLDDDEESPQSILDYHLSRWKSAVVTPSRSPGSHTPHQASMSQLSSSSHLFVEPGAFQSFNRGDSYRASHHATKPSHTSRTEGGSNGEEVWVRAQPAAWQVRRNASQGGGWGAGSEKTGRGAHVPQTGVRNGVIPENHGYKPQGFHDISLPPDVPNERVMMWMLDKDKYGGGGSKTRYSTDDSERTFSNKHSSQRSVSSGGKKSSSHRSRRSESLDRSKLHAVNLSTSSDVTNVLLNNSIHSADIVTQTNAQQSGAGPQINRADISNRNMVNRSQYNQHSAQYPVDNGFDASSMPAPISTNVPGRSSSTGRFVSSSHSTANISAHDRANNQTNPYSTSASVLPHNLRQPQGANNIHPVDNASREMSTVVGYYLCDEPIPYRSSLPGNRITLAQFKQLIAKRGNYRYFFKTVSNEFDSGVVHEEVKHDDEVLPMWQGKIFAKVERIT